MEREQDDRLLTREECASIFCIKPDTWYRWSQSDPDFPKPYLNEKRLKRWWKSDVFKYLDTRQRRNEYEDVAEAETIPKIGGQGGVEGGREADTLGGGIRQRATRSQGYRKHRRNSHSQRKK